MARSCYLQALQFESLIFKLCRIIEGHGADNLKGSDVAEHASDSPHCGAVTCQ